MKDSNNFNSFPVKELLFFNKLIMPTIITVIYWIVSTIVILGGLYTMFFGGSFFYGLIFIVFGVVLIRILFEMICVVFSINRNLEKLVELQLSSRKQVSTPEQIGAEADANTPLGHNH